MFKRVYSRLNIIRFVPHALFYFMKKNEISLDIKRCKEHHDIDVNGLSGLLYLLTFDKSFRAVFYFRIGLWSNLISFLAPSFDSLMINSHSKIGHSALFVHAFSTIINHNGIGDNFRITHGCTIGNSKGGRPIIKNNVTIHTGAIIFGDIVIGNNVIIGAGSVINKSVPDNCVVIGNPAYIIKKGDNKTCEKL
ncbi:serine O-acetyltransferase [Polaribacter sp. 20A6]|uniref:serine O-acetyltransferase n=1 Tax=Polaribacter sp. 20A6 TaxID=2687289 RepID=UPI00197B0ECC|nr:hypothetical protein [Polaribacter sp. 20A6]